MHKKSLPCLVALYFMAGSGWAMEGEFDRSAEVAKYVELAKNGTRGDLLLASKDIYVSGIADARLSEVLSERLLADYTTFKNGNRSDSQYGQWVLKALASTGTEQAVATLKKVQGAVKLGSVRTEAGDELDLIEWHRQKNRIMASRANHQAGQDERSSQLLNLLKSDDFSYKHMAADRISWEKRLEPRLLDEMAAQLPLYMEDTKGAHASRQQSKATGLYIKLLGYSGDAKYRPLLQQVEATSKSLTLKQHAREALSRLE